ncbi:MAG: hypothetical protein CME64_09620 [Halobacteriovoraceae bacterium]|nr:hypothetical protein [Halobacteriovoraceae bacterium]|tara:strand:- start:10565 stop:11206 length:642 start_codon:yes stop_codon:yes gene_type:complete
MMEKNNVVKLIDYINSQKMPDDSEHFEFFPLSKEKTTLRRAFAFMSDFTCVLMLNLMVLLSYATFVTNFFLPMSPTQKVSLLQMGDAFSFGVFTLIYFTYFLYCGYALNGKTLGCHIMKLNIIDEAYPHKENMTSSEPSLSQAFKRSLAYVACYFSMGMFFFLSLLHEEKRGIPDFFSKTRVVSDEWLKSFEAAKEGHKEHISIDINSLDKAA